MFLLLRCHYLTKCQLVGIEVGLFIVACHHLFIYSYVLGYYPSTSVFLFSATITQYYLKDLSPLISHYIRSGFWRHGRLHYIIALSIPHCLCCSF
jgi:hypothetical protein